MDTFTGEIRETKTALDRISASFCAAKWLQVTLHLHRGLTHSCHHVEAHEISREDLKANPSGLHNTNAKKLRRKEMLEGQRPTECDYCWKNEDLAPNVASDRLIKSNDTWARSELQQISSLPWDQDVEPTYVEASFAKTCQFKCIYCSHAFSSAWAREMQEFGAFPRRDFQPFDAVDEKRVQEMALPGRNPYIAAFWQWWPRLYPKLKVFRLTGGEPLLDPQTFRLLDEIERHPQPNRELDLSLNSNLGVAAKTAEKLALQIRRLLEQKRIRKFELYASVDTWGSRAEYIRTGLQLEVFARNIEIIMTALPTSKLTIMCTFNALSVSSFDALIEQVQRWKQRYSTMLDVSYLRYPSELSVLILPSRYQAYVKKSLELMSSLDFQPYELNKLQRVYDLMQEDDPERRRRQYQFSHLIRELDRRRKTDFMRIFPEMAVDFLKWSSPDWAVAVGPGSETRAE